MLILHLYIQPGAKTTQVDGLHDGRIKIRIKASPVEGKANQALCDFLSTEFGVKKSDVEVISGQTSRYKTVRILNPSKSPKGWITD